MNSIGQFFRGRPARRLPPRRSHLRAGGGAAGDIRYRDIITDSPRYDVWGRHPHRSWLASNVEIPLHLLYGSDPQPGTYQAIFSAPPGVTPELDYWSSGDPTKIGHADLIEATLDGKPVWIATFPVQPGTYHFLASAGGPGGIGVSDVGTTTIGH